jgi:hypothetical protein
MAAGAIRGSRIGSGPMGEAERGEAAPRKAVTYFCVNDHQTVLQFALEAEPPETWDCPRCGMPASPDAENRPTAPKTEPYKTHLAYVKERRSEDEAQVILTEALDSLRARRKSGEVIF